MLSGVTRRTRISNGLVSGASITWASRYSPEILPVIVTVFIGVNAPFPTLVSITIVTEVFLWLPCVSCSTKALTPTLSRTRVTLLSVTVRTRGVACVTSVLTIVVDSIAEKPLIGSCVADPGRQETLTPGTLTTPVLLVIGVLFNLNEERCS
ncbi:Uncharacterised protein [Yersinia enterocolitica]|nr:Uncharacterised protein [Yersinia enterocolitica]